MLFANHYCIFQLFDSSTHLVDRVEATIQTNRITHLRKKQNLKRQQQQVIDKILKNEINILNSIFEGNV